MIRILWMAAALALPLVVLAEMLLRAVNVPFLDEWSWAPLAVASRDGTLRWDAIVAQHNEHRNVVANLLFLAVDRTIGFNILAEQLVSFAILAAGQVAAWFLVRATTVPQRRGPLFAVISLLLWSFAQWENFALGYNVGWNVCTTALLVVLASFAGRAGVRDFACGAVAAFVASFASAQGLMLWPIGFALLAGNAPRRIPTLVAWCAVATVSLVAFFAGYAPSPASAGVPLGAVIAYFFGVLGTPIGAWWGLPACIAVGALGFVAFVGLVSRRGATGHRVLWSCAAAYAIANAAVIAVSRWTFGPESALSSHYAAIALFLFVAVAGLTAASWDQITAGPRWALAAALVLVAYGMLDADLHGNRAWQLYAIARRAEVCAFAAHDDTALATLADADTGWVEREAAALARVGDLPYRTAERGCVALGILRGR